MSCAPPQSPSDLVAVLLGAQVLLLGSPQEVSRVDALLAYPSTSRTISYLCCIASNCGEIVECVDRINKATVAIIGCGGIGSLSALLLAGAGIKTFYLADPDIIEKSNLNRQLVWEAGDIGKAKVSVLKRALSRRFCGLTIRSTRLILDSEEKFDKVLRGATTAVITADHPLGVGRIAADACHRLGVTAIDGGYLFDESVVTLASSGEAIGAWSKLPGGIAPSYGPTNVEIAAILSNIAILSIGGIRKVVPTSFTWKNSTFPKACVAS